MYLFTLHAVLIWLRSERKFIVGYMPKKIMGANKLLNGLLHVLRVGVLLLAASLLVSSQILIEMKQVIASIKRRH